MSSNSFLRYLKTVELTKMSRGKLKLHCSFHDFTGCNIKTLKRAIIVIANDCASQVVLFVFVHRVDRERLPIFLHYLLSTLSDRFYSKRSCFRTFLDVSSLFSDYKREEEN